MKILYFDASAGISGDMFVGSLIDLGASIEKIHSHLDSLGLDGIIIQSKKIERQGFIGTKFDVLDTQTGYNVDIYQSQTQPHRGLQEIRKIIRSSALPGPVAADALGVFELIGNAEAKVHGVHPDEIHFHEIGALDAIADIVSAASAFHQFDVDEAWCSAIHVGYGTVQCTHGILPVPAPATSELLKGIPTYSNGVRGELATPTGAALARYFCRRFSPEVRMNISATGYGFGSKNFGIPNLLRAFLVEVSNSEE